jgi:hypothetical protein
MKVSLSECTGAAEMSVFQGLSAGNMLQPSRLGLTGAPPVEDEALEPPLLTDDVLAPPLPDAPAPPPVEDELALLLDDATLELPPPEPPFVAELLAVATEALVPPLPPPPSPPPQADATRDRPATAPTTPSRPVMRTIVPRFLTTEQGPHPHR